MIKCVLEPLIVLKVILGEQTTSGRSTTWARPTGMRPAALILLLYGLLIWIMKHGLFKGAVPGAWPWLHLDQGILTHFDPIEILEVHVAHPSGSTIAAVVFLFLLFGEETTCNGWWCTHKQPWIIRWIRHLWWLPSEFIQFALCEGRRFFETWSLICLSRTPEIWRVWPIVVVSNRLLF